MAINKYYDSDCNLGVLDGKTVAVIGFGSQGHAHSENLAESGVNVVVGLRKGSAHWEKASEFAATHENFKVMEVEEAAKAGDVVMMLVPDELCADIYNTQVAPYMTEGKALAFAHGFNIHFKTITPPKNVDVIMIAPKGPGHIVRRLYTEGEGLINEGGFSKMRYSISNTAEYGDYRTGKRLITEDTRKEMKQVLKEIQDGTFASEFLTEMSPKGGRKTHFLAQRRIAANHPIEKVGAELRKMMSWLKK